MIRSSATITLVPELRSGPFLFSQDLHSSCETAAKLGFDAVEILPASVTDLDASELGSLLSSHSLELSSIGTGAGFLIRQLHLCSADRQTRVESVQFIVEMIEFAEVFGASVIIGSMQGRAEPGMEQATVISHLCETLNELGAIGRKHGVLLLIEPLNRYETNVFNRLDQGVELIRSLATDNVKLLADLFHMNIEEKSICGALQGAADYIGHIHFVDSNRLAAGYGHIDFAAVSRTLREINYEGYAASEALPCPDPEAAAERSMKTFCEHIAS